MKDITLEQWNQTITANLTSAFIITQAVVPSMQAKRWGRIINLTSIAAQNGGVTGPAYAASKAGLIGMTHSYARLLAAQGITCNAISPALVESDMVLSNPNAKPDIVPVKAPWWTQRKLAQVAVMLASTGYMTGQTISINGGM